MLMLLHHIKSIKSIKDGMLIIENLFIPFIPKNPKEQSVEKIFKTFFSLRISFKWDTCARFHFKKGLKKAKLSTTHELVY